MKKNIHPISKKVSVFCSCGTNFLIFSTFLNDMQLDICSKCHPFYTGKQRTINKGGRVQKFKKRFNLSIK